MAIDLRSHGGSEGNYNSLGMMEALDMLGAVDYLHKIGDKRPIVLMGFSLGSAASINAAEQFQEAAAVIAEGAYGTYWQPISVFAKFALADPDISFIERIKNTIVDWPFVNFLFRLEVWYHAGVFLVSEKASAIESIKKILNTPILFLTGENDFIPIETNVKEMLKASKNPQKVIDKIIRHLKLTFHAERPPPPQIVQKELLMAAEERGEYF